MSYYQKVLQPGETVRQVARLHWITFARAIGVLIAAICVLALALSYGNHEQQQAGLYVALALGAIGVLLWIGAAMRRVGVEMVVTDRRVIYKRGFIHRYTVEMNVSKIETVDVLQSFWGRLLGYGTVLIRGTGSTFEPLPRVAHPLALRNAITAG
ncbi:MAG TPA: PH domain-containing protein [Acidisphaera sp.]|nr:PH domain-containing protein [Acidisphaera sp.]